MKYTTNDFFQECQKLKDLYSKKYGMNIVFEGNQCAATADTIYLPELPDNMPLTPKELEVLRGGLDHEAGHPAETNYADMYAWMKAHKNQEDVDKKFHMFNILEDTRMEERVMSKYPGARKNLKSLVETIVATDEQIDKVISEFPDEWSKKCSSAWVKVRQEHHGIPVSEKAQKLMDLNKEENEEIYKETIEAESSMDIIKIVDRLYEETTGNPPPTPEEIEEQKQKQKEQEQEEGQEEGQSGKASMEENMEARKGVFRLLEGSDEFKGKPVEDVLKERGELNPEAGIHPFFVDKSRDVIFERPSSGKYDGWNPFDKSYQGVLIGVGSSLKTSKNIFRRALLSRDNRGWERGRVSGLLDNKRYAQAIQGIPNVRKRRETVVEYNTAVHLLVDLSGSMCGTEYETAVSLAAILLEATKGTSVKVAVSGHTTKFNNFGKKKTYRNVQVMMPLFKDYDESISKARKELDSFGRIGLDENADACALGYAMRSLAKRPEERKILVVISDGLPSFRESEWVYRNYPGTIYNTQLHQMLKLQEMFKKSHGIETIGLGIGAEHITEYYKEGYYVENVDHFVKEVMDIMSQKLLGRVY